MCIFGTGFNYNANHAYVLDHYRNVNVKVINIKNRTLK